MQAAPGCSKSASVRSSLADCAQRGARPGARSRAPGGGWQVRVGTHSCDYPAEVGLAMLRATVSELRADRTRRIAFPGPATGTLIGAGALKSGPVAIAHG